MEYKNYPSEIWVYIFKFLNPFELTPLALVCKQFYELSQEEQIWKQFIGGDAWVADEIDKYNKKQSFEYSKISQFSKLYSKKLYLNWFRSETREFKSKKNFRNQLHPIDFGTSFYWLKKLIISFIDPDDIVEKVFKNSNIELDDYHYFQLDQSFTVDGETVMTHIESENVYESRMPVYQSIEGVVRASNAVFMLENSWNGNIESAIRALPKISKIVVITNKKFPKKKQIKGIDILNISEIDGKNLLQEVVTSLYREIKAHCPKYLPTRDQILKSLSIDKF